MEIWCVVFLCNNPADKQINKQMHRVKNMNIWSVILCTASPPPPHVVPQALAGLWHSSPSGLCDCVTASIVAPKLLLHQPHPVQSSSSLRRAIDYLPPPSPPVELPPDDVAQYNHRKRKVGRVVKVPTSFTKPVQQQRCTNAWGTSCAWVGALRCRAGGTRGLLLLQLHNNNNNNNNNSNVCAGATRRTLRTAGPSPQPGTSPRASGLRWDGTSTGLSPGLEPCTPRTQCSQTGRFQCSRRTHSRGRVCPLFS